MLYSVLRYASELFYLYMLRFKVAPVGNKYIIYVITPFVL